MASYGTTACAWDSVIPFAPMWECIKRVIKPKGAVVLFGSQPFTSALVMSNPKWFRYQWVWEKDNAANFMTAKLAPLRYHEDVCVFSEASGVYNPIMWDAGKPSNQPGKSPKTKTNGVFNPLKEKDDYERFDNGRYPKSIIRFNRIKNNCDVGQLHPTQKPVDLMAYLIKTYTSEGDTVLDFTFGSCSTGVACLETGRNFIGIEKDPDYFRVGKERMEKREKELIEVGAIPLSYDRIGKGKSDYQVRSLFEYQQILEMGLYDEQK